MKNRQRTLKIIALDKTILFTWFLPNLHLSCSTRQSTWEGQSTLFLQNCTQWGVLSYSAQFLDWHSSSGIPKAGLCHGIPSFWWRPCVQDSALFCAQSTWQIVLKISSVTEKQSTSLLISIVLEVNDRSLLYLMLLLYLFPKKNEQLKDNCQCILFPNFHSLSVPPLTTSA